MKHTRLIPIIIVAIMLFNCFMPLATVNATTTAAKKIQLNKDLYAAVEKQLEEQGIIATCDDLKRTITISNEELAKVTYLDLSEKGISDVTGLDAFSSLTQLDLSSNKLTKESNLKVLSSLNLKKLDLSTNNIEDISEITNLDSITELNLHNQKFSQVEVITLDTSKTAENQIIVSKELPQILVEAGILEPDWLIATKSYPGNHSELNFVWTGFDNDLTDGPSSVDINVGKINEDGDYTMYNGLLKLNINIKDKTNPLSESDINLYYLVIDSTQRAAVFKDAKLYNKVKEQLTHSTAERIYNDYNEDLRTYAGEGGENGDTLYSNAYDEPMILTFNIDTLINEIPTLKVSNLQVEDISGIETFVGLEENLDLSYNYIKSIEKIAELQNNKNIEEEKLQARFNAELSILKARRAKLMEAIKKVEEVEKKIAAAEAEIHKAWTAIDYLNPSDSDYSKKRDEQLKIIEQKNKELNGYEQEDGKKVIGLREQKDLLIVEADRQLALVIPSLRELYRIYNKEYKATTILTLNINNMTEEEYYNLTYDNAKNLYKAQIDRIANLEKSKSLSNADKKALEEMMGGYPEKNENGEIENPISTELLKRYEENQEIWNLSSYRAMIKDFIDLDVKLKFMNYMSIYMMYEDYSDIELLELEIEYFEKSIEENEDKVSTITETRYYNVLIKDEEQLTEEERDLKGEISDLIIWANKNKEEVNSIIETEEGTTEEETTEEETTEEETTEESENKYLDPLSFILALSGKFVNLTAEEVKSYITLPDLKKLNLKNNMIEDLTQMEVLTELRELNVSENEILNVNNVDWSKISKLKVLNLNHNFISDINELESLKKLEELHLSDNLLEGRFTFRIASMPKLKIADFSVNRYTDISSLVDQYEFIAKDKEMTVSEYLASEDTIEIILYNQLLEIDVGKFIVKEGEQQVENVQLPAIITQLKELDPTNTVYETVSILGKVRNDGTVGLIISKEEGKHTGMVSVDSLLSNRISMGHGTVCVINYEVMNSKVNDVEIKDGNNFEVEVGKTLQFKAGVNGINVEDTSVTWGISGQTSGNTKIDEDGLLTIGEDEVPGTEITVIVTSNYDSSVSETAKVKVVKLNTNVTMTPGATEGGLEQGSSKTYSAVVTTEAEDKSVRWTIEGQTSENTKIDENGILTIGEDEVVGTKIVVKATSNYDDTKFAFVEEVVIEKVKEVVVSINETATVKGLEPGATKTYTVTVTTEAEDKTVTWSIEGNKSQNTKIDNNGTLTIGEDEVIGTKIVVKATSNYDNTKFAFVEEMVVESKVELNKPSTETEVFEQTPGTTVASFVEGLVEDGNTVKVVDKDGNEVSNTEKLSTGMKVIVNDKAEYTVVVTGDINFDGKVDSLDSEMIKAARLGSISLTDVQKQAADINADGKVNRIDSFIMLLYRAGSREVRDFTTETIENIMK